MGVIAALTGALTTVVFWTIGWAVAFFIAGIVAFRFCNRRRWLQITERGPRWFKALTLLGLVALSPVIGGLTGFQLGLLKSGGDLAADFGVELTHQVVAKAALVSGIALLDQGVEKESVVRLVDAIEKAKLIDMTGVKAVVLKKTVDLVVVPLVPRAKEMLATYPAGSKITPNTFIASLRDQAKRDIRRYQYQLMALAFGHGVLWLLVICALPILVAALLRPRRASAPIAVPDR